MTQTLIHTPESSNIAAFGYSPESQALTVQFRHGGSYVYRDVPSGVFERMQAAPSKGKFLSREVKGRFKFEKAREFEI